MKTKYIGYSDGKPKNFSKNGLICTCLVPIILAPTNNYKLVKSDMTTIVYNITPYDISRRVHNYKKSDYPDYGYIKNIVEITGIIKNLDEGDFEILTSSFKRDKSYMPYPYRIKILNVDKYLNLKQKEYRKNKLSKIKDYE